LDSTVRAFEKRGEIKTHSLSQGHEKEEHPMSRVRVLVGTRKGLFILTADGTRKSWKVNGPHFAGWEIYHAKGSPADPKRLYVSQSTGWHGQIEEMWVKQLGAPPAVDVCAYNKDDLEALGMTIDQLTTALELIAHHDHVIAIEGDTTTTGAPAIRRILSHARPNGTSTDAWQALTAAAAQTLATAKPC